MPHNRSASRTLAPLSSGADEALRTLAQARFPGGVAVPHDEEGHGAVAETKRLLQGGATTLYDAAFAHEGIMVVFDALTQRRGRWFGFLLRPSTRIKEKHLLDLAVMDHVCRSAGFVVDEPALLLLNAQYVRRGAIDANDLFCEERVGRRLRHQQPHIRGRMQMLRRIHEKDRKRAEKAAAEGAPAPAPFAADRYAQPVPPLTGPVEIQVDLPLLRSFLGALQYPLYFMDFEAYQTAIPEWDGHWPFRQLPFQFSVHRQEAPGAGLQHVSFIAEGADEPVAAFGKALLETTGDRGSVVVYNRDSEQLILNQLETDHPEWAAAIEGLRARLFDLQTPFLSGWVKIPANGNKVSLKYVLPALVPEMSYTALTIGGGEEANLAYNRLRSETDPEAVRKTREDLAAYCALDTLAMVHILARLQELAAG